MQVIAETAQAYLLIHDEMPFLMTKNEAFEEGNPVIGSYMDWRGETRPIRLTSLYGQHMILRVTEYKAKKFKEGLMGDGKNKGKG